MLPATKVAIARRTIELCLDGPLDFGELVAMILPEVRKLEPGLTFVAVLKTADRAYLLEGSRRMRGAVKGGTP